jgi:hypothetical protein
MRNATGKYAAHPGPISPWKKAVRGYDIFLSSMTP